MEKYETPKEQNKVAITPQEALKREIELDENALKCPSCGENIDSNPTFNIVLEKGLEWKKKYAELIKLLRKMWTEDGSMYMDGETIQQINKIIWPNSEHDFHKK